MKQLLFLLLIPMLAISQPTCTDYTTDGNLQANKVYCLPSGTYGVINSTANATIVIQNTNVTIGNINGRFKIYIINSVVNFTSSRNFNGGDSMFISNSMVSMKSVELQNGSNYLEVKDESNLTINGDKQILDNTSSIYQCGSVITVMQNYTVNGGPGKHTLCGCAELHVKDRMNINAANVFTGIGFIKVNAANYNQQLTNSSGIAFCGPNPQRLGAAVATCGNPCVPLSLREPVARPAIQPNVKYHWRVIDMSSYREYEIHCTYNELRKRVGRGMYVAISGQNIFKFQKL